jgi:hypothetical protein
MTTDRFFQGFVAAMRLQGHDHIDTVNDVHHEAFHKVAEALEAARRRGAAGAAAMPRTLISNPITGRYRDFDAALANMQRGSLVTARNPVYRRVDLELSPEEAEGILALYPQEEQELFGELAQAFPPQ